MIRWTGPALAVVLAAALPAQGPRERQSFQTAGLNCVLVETHERPLIRVELVTRWDRGELPAGKEGIAGFLVEAIEAGGAGAYNRAAFSRALDALGMTFSFKARMGVFRWTMVADSRSQETAMELLADAVVRPAFDGPLVENERKELLRQAGAQTPRERGIALFLWSLGDPAAMTVPGAQGFDRIEFQDLIDFRRRVIRPESSTLLLYGDLNLSQAKQLVLMHLGIWGPSDQAPVKGIPAKAAAKAVPDPCLMAVFDPAPGAELWAGAPRPRTSEPAVEALLPILLARASRSLFGTFEMAFQLPPEGHSPLLIKAKVPLADRDALVSGFTAALAGLRRNGFSQEDLACALIQWKAENSALALHPEAMLRELADGRLEPELARAVDQVTLARVDQVLRDWLDPERVRFLLLGADTPMLQAAEQAGLKPSALVGSE
jgi:predicted Zn-dependent peptidase